jgi:hypothetical protein
MMDMNEARAMMAAHIDAARQVDAAQLREAVESAMHTGEMAPIDQAIQDLMRAPAETSAR